MGNQRFFAKAADESVGEIRFDLCKSESSEENGAICRKVASICCWENLPLV